MSTIWYSIIKRLYNGPVVVSKAERTKVLKQWTDFFFSSDPPYPGMTYIMLARLLHLLYVFTSNRTQSEEVCTQTIEKEIENLAEKKWYGLHYRKVSLKSWKKAAFWCEKAAFQL